MYQQYKFVNQTQLGRMFGVTSHVMGRWLVEIGLRTVDLKPSRKAFDGGFMTKADTGRGAGWYYVWHRRKTIAALEAAGYKRVETTPAPVANGGGGLKGPFELHPSDNDIFELRNTDGQFNVRIFGRKDAELLLRMLNLAHKHGVVA